eukprot:Gb_11043 [translate_table: standard]
MQRTPCHSPPRGRGVRGTSRRLAHMGPNFVAQLDFDVHGQPPRDNKETIPQCSIYECQFSVSFTHHEPTKKYEYNGGLGKDFDVKELESFFPKDATQPSIQEIEKKKILKSKEPKEELWTKVATEGLFATFENIYLKTNATFKTIYNKEKQLESSTGSKPSKWVYYNDMQRIIGKTPKVKDLSTGFNGEEWVNQAHHANNDGDNDDMEEIHTDFSNNVGNIESDKDQGPSNQLDQSETSMRIKRSLSPRKTPVEGKHVKKSKTFVDSFGDTIERSVTYFANTLKDIENNRMEDEKQFQWQASWVPLEALTHTSQNTFCALQMPWSNTL